MTSAAARRPADQPNRWRSSRVRLVGRPVAISLQKVSLDSLFHGAQSARSHQPLKLPNNEEKRKNVEPGVTACLID